MAHAKRNLGRIAQHRKRTEQAEQWLREALALYQSIGVTFYAYLTTANLTAILMDQGDLDAAWTLCKTALETAKQPGGFEHVASLQYWAGRIAYEQGDLEQAESFWMKALDYDRKQSYYDGAATCQFWLGKLRLDQKRQDEAKERLEEAQDIWERLGLQAKVLEVGELLSDTPS